MAALTETTKREFSKRVLDILNSNAGELQTAGVDVKGMSTDLSKLVDDAFSAEEKQLRAQTEANKATSVSQTATEAAYKNASARVELIVGALGKGDALSKRLRNLRDEVAKEASRGKERQSNIISKVISVLSRVRSILTQVRTIITLVRSNITYVGINITQGRFIITCVRINITWVRNILT